MSNKQKVHEPLFHISKRASMPWYYSWLIRLVSILAALIVSGAVTMTCLESSPKPCNSSLRCACVDTGI